MLANDGVDYTDEQYSSCEKFLREFLEGQGYHVSYISKLEIVGSLTAFKKNDCAIGEYFMRDLTMGVIRHGRDAMEEYQQAVWAAGLC